jgi:hypothetical protein
MATLPVGTDNVPKFLVLVQSSWRVIAIAITLRTSPRFAAGRQKDRARHHGTYFVDLDQRKSSSRFARRRCLEWWYIQCPDISSLTARLIF